MRTLLLNIFGLIIFIACVGVFLLGAAGTYLLVRDHGWIWSLTAWPQLNYWVLLADYLTRKNKELINGTTTPTI